MSQAQKQDFIGGLIVAELAKAGAKKVISSALNKVAKSTHTKMAAEDVAPATAIVTKELREDLQAKVEHTQDAEPHWQSRNLWGSFIGVVTAIETIRTFWMDDQVQTMQEWFIPIGILATALTPLYSRFIAKKPLFR